MARRFLQAHDQLPLEAAAARRQFDRLEAQLGALAAKILEGHLGRLVFAGIEQAAIAPGGNGVADVAFEFGTVGILRGLETAGTPAPSVRELFAFNIPLSLGGTFLALSGLLVVSLEQAVAAPYCSSRLADAGARVIKIERPEGDFARGYDKAAKGLSSYFVWLNRGKQSLVADIKDPAENIDWTPPGGGDGPNYADM